MDREPAEGYGIARLGEAQEWEGAAYRAVVSLSAHPPLPVLRAGSGGSEEGGGPDWRERLRERGKSEGKSLNPGAPSRFVE